ncbi:hypothetical protein AURDEDRAFT_174541 [Auricularia subglabra TFB-10046 SS5]|uniref:Uncharacterized protein n=1 Tax=Auricularia subglabra (strain TFB-10046 / SS5) TaxID=717982 RepID=J0CYN3_AURST|nr:hypothetical protein AURDEDRAFT_174541 [Auricularia subglabra TFB-10046 SS5]
MPAARKVIGFVSAKATMACPFCKCTYRELSLRSMIDGHGEPRRRSEWLRQALRYRQASTDAERTIYKRVNGVAWSELLRLPYWDPTKFTVVDAMHNLFLGLIKFHICNVWLVEEAAKQTKPPKLRKRAKKLIPPQIRERFRKALQPTMIRKAEAILDETSDSKRWEKLQRTTIAVLEHLCAAKQLTVQIRGRKLKAHYIDALRKWDVERNSGSHTVAQPSQSAPSAIPDSTPPPSPASPASPIGEVEDACRTSDTNEAQSSSAGTERYKLLPDELTQIRDIVHNISTPSWLGRVATDFGSPSHGTPKADEWRTAGTIHLPIALTTMWAGTSKQKELDWFMNLATAIQLATRRSTSEVRAEEYRSQMRKYLHGLRERGFLLRPNHHAALHLADFLPRFGPTHGWWSFPLERQVGVLQQFNTNDRYGELERTIMASYHRAAQVRTLISEPHPDCAPVLQSTILLAKNFLPLATTGSLATGTLVHTGTSAPRVDYEKARRLDETDYALLKQFLGGDAQALSPRAQYLKRVQHRGVSFATQLASFDDSNVLFERGNGRVGAGRISGIFVHERRHQDARISETFVVLERFIRAGAAEQALCASAPAFHHAQLYLTHTRADGTLWAGERTIIRLSSVLCHLAVLVVSVKAPRIEEGR